ncbi:MAG: glycoside hydrolase family 28 protein [Lachnospiraceae bacterium]|nr:glycoside hydrolase family 28 protein [Lachnospiraceae bacterium]
MLNVNENACYIPKNLMCPPAACTDTSIALVWDEPEKAEEVAGYQVFINGHRYHTLALREENKREPIDTTHTDFTLINLASDLEYTLEVCSVLVSGEISKFCEPIRVKALAKKKQFDITDFGAVGDGVTNNTRDIQRAIDGATEGGIVYVPAGTFVTGAIFLKSDITLYLEEGAVLLGSDNLEDYPIMEYRFEGREQRCYASLINTKDMLNGQRLKNITIAGPGTIDANGVKLYRQELDRKEAVRGRAVCLRNVDNVYMHEVTVRQSPAWCIHPIYCNGISINNIRVYTKCDENGNKYGIHNGDGIDPDSCSDVYIFNSMIASQDDCIAIKSGRDEEGRRVGIPTKNVRITNCRFRSGFGVAIGSEMSGGVMDVLVKDCDFEDVYSIGTVKAPRGRGNVIDNITYEKIRFVNNSLEHKDCRWFRGAIYVDQFYSHAEFDPSLSEEVNEGTAKIKNITFKDIVMSTIAGNAIYLAGLPESNLENICFDNVHAAGKYGMKAYNVDGLKMTNVKVASMEDKDYEFENVRY